MGAFRATPGGATAGARAKARREAATARKAAADLKPRVACLDALPGSPDDAPVPPEVAVGVPDAAYQVLFEYELTGDPPVVGTRPFLAQLGRAETAAHRVPWTAGLERRQAARAGPPVAAQADPRGG